MKPLILILLATFFFSCEKEEVQPDYVTPPVPRYLKLEILDCDSKVIKVFVLDQKEVGDYPIGVKRETCKGLAITNSTFYGKIKLEFPEEDEFTNNYRGGYPTLVQHNREDGIKVTLLENF